MSVIPFRTFSGEIPRLSTWELPEGNAKQAVNCDLGHGDLRGLRGNAPFATAVLPGALRAVYTDDGVDFYAWPYEVYPVKSMVVGEIYSRFYYTAMQADGPIIKVSRTRRADGSDNPPKVIGTSMVGGNFQPPENSTTPDINLRGNTSLARDTWILGVPAPAVQGGTDPVTKYQDNLTATLVDKTAWPAIPKLQLRVTYFLESLDGQIVFQQDITNTEAGIQSGTGPNGTNTVFPQVLYTNPPNDNASGRGNLFQDMLWSFSTKTPRPYKYYFFLPPSVAAAALARTVLITNTGTGPMTITYNGSVTPDTSPPNVVGGGNEA